MVDELARYDITVEDGQLKEEINNEQGQYIRYEDLEPVVSYYEEKFERHELMIRGYEEIILTLSTKGDRKLDDFDDELKSKIGKKGMEKLQNQLVEAMIKRDLSPNVLRRKNKEK
jgi:hypothetical protein